MESDRPKSQREKYFEEAVRQAADRYKGQKDLLSELELAAREDPCFARVAATAMLVEARSQRRLWRRYLYGRFGVKVYSHEETVHYEQRRPERAPETSQERLLRAKAVVGHAEWENRWKALSAGLAFFGTQERFHHAVRLMCDALRQMPAIWGNFTEKAREPDDSVREHAAAELAGWLDSKTRLYPRTRRAVSGREGKLRELAPAALAAWVDLQPQRCDPARRPRHFGYSLDFVLGSKSSDAELMQ